MIPQVEIPGLLLIPHFPVFGLRSAYGWKSARTLARVGPDVNGIDNWNERAPDHNADSIALFGSACKLLDDSQWPRRVLEDGRIEVIGV